MKSNRSLIVLVAIALAASLSAKEIVVSNTAELNAAIAKATPGDTIVMRNGSWNNAVIEFNAAASSSMPVTLRAQTPGEVILDGTSMLTFSKPHLIVDGLFFKNGSIDKHSVISFNSEHCRLTNTAILDYNPESFDTKYYWVYFRGSHNRVDHCFFKGKSNMNPVMGNDDENARHNMVDHCYIKDIPYVPDANGREILRIWGYGHSDEMGDDGAYFTVEYNLFERAHGEGTEIVSLKSNFNIVRYNTVRASRGGLVSRRGKNNTIEGNFIFGENVEGTTGIRVAGQNHRVVNNYISDVDDDGLRLIAGEYFAARLTDSFKPKKKDLPKYIQVVDGYFAHNTVINAGGNGIDIGFSYKNQWPDLQMVLLPERNTFVNNLVLNCKKTGINIAVQDTGAPLDIFSFGENRFEGNIVFGDAKNGIGLPKGAQRIDPQMTKGSDGIFRPAHSSPVLNSGSASDVRTDMDGQVRDGTKDVGADEKSETKSVQHPLTANDVGPGWIILKRNAGETF